MLGWDLDRSSVGICVVLNTGTFRKRLLSGDSVIHAGCACRPLFELDRRSEFLSHPFALGVGARRVGTSSVEF